MTDGGLAAVQPRVFALFQLFDGDRKHHASMLEHLLIIAMLLSYRLKVVRVTEFLESARLAASTFLVFAMTESMTVTRD